MSAGAASAPKSSPRARRAPVRGLIDAHLLCGAAWLVAAGRFGWDVPSSSFAWRRRVFARALGARHLGEAALLSRRPTRGGMLTAASIDALHALSMIGLAHTAPAWRRLAQVSATGAVVLCAYAVCCSRRR